MLYRFLAVPIVVFWVVMTALLVRKEIGPGDSSLREVPVGHVVKLMFLHEQPSDLHLYNEKLRVGHTRIFPKIRKEDGRRVIEFSGSLQVVIPGVPRQRVAWSGELEMDKLLEVQQFKITLTFRDPTPTMLDVTVDPRAQSLVYETRSGDRVLDHGSYSLDEQGALSWLKEQGLDPALLQAVHSPRSASPQVKALQSFMEIRGEKIDTYLISIEQGGQTLLEFHVSQLGQILQARSFIGYSAAPEDLLP